MHFKNQINENQELISSYFIISFKSGFPELFITFTAFSTKRSNIYIQVTYIQIHKQFSHSHFGKCRYIGFRSLQHYQVQNRGQCYKAEIIHMIYSHKVNSLVLKSICLKRPKEKDETNRNLKPLFQKIMYLTDDT